MDVELSLPSSLDLILSLGDMDETPRPVTDHGGEGQQLAEATEDESPEDLTTKAANERRGNLKALLALGAEKLRELNLVCNAVTY